MTTHIWWSINSYVDAGVAVVIIVIPVVVVIWCGPINNCTDIEMGIHRDLQGTNLSEVVKPKLDHTKTF